MAVDKAVDSGELNALMTRIGDAIREKDGTTGLIPDEDMPERIRAIQTGYDTSDATVTAKDLAKNVTAYGPNGEVTGNVKTVASGGYMQFIPKNNSVAQSADDALVVIAPVSSAVLFRAGSKIRSLAKLSELGDATAADVAKGKTFTSAAGFRVVGTYDSAEPPEKYAALVEQAKALYGGSYEAVLIQETVGQVNIGFLTKAFAVERYQPYSTEFRAKGWYQVRFDKADTAATPSAQDWRESPSQGGDYGSTIRFCGQKILCGTQQIYPRTYNIGDGMGAANGDGSYLGIFIGKPDNPGTDPNKHIVILPAEIFLGEPETAAEN